MKITTFAAIYIGSYEVSLKVFELSGKGKLRTIDHVRSRIELGKDAYTKGYIGYKLVDELCDTLKKFTGIMTEYGVDAYRAYTSMVIRDAKNELFIIDQIHLRTGLDVQVLSNSEHRFISYKSVASLQNFDDMTKESATVVDVGGGSIQMTLFVKGKVITTQNIVMGTMRIREKLSTLSKDILSYEKEIEELVDKELRMFKSMYLKDISVKNVIMIGDYLSEIIQSDEKSRKECLIGSKHFLKYMEHLYGMKQEELAETLHLSNERDPLVVPAIVLYKRIFETLNGEQLWVPGVDISDGIVCDYAQANKLMKPQHDFDKDVLSAAEQISKRYMSFSPHIQALTEMADKIFDAMKKVHGMGKREKLLLTVAALLHDCGKYISYANHSECSYEIIIASEIIGLTHLEREIVANTVLYNAQPLPSYEELANKMDQQSYLIVAKLAAILKLSNAMDRSHKQKFKNIRIVLKDKKLLITVEAEDNILLEKELFASRAEFFESIYSVKPVIREKSMFM
ncbi:MAG: HD domain-containing protein [Lachnospiraceae bacterium]